MKIYLSAFRQPITVCLTLCVMLFFSATFSHAENTTPELIDGHKWRIAYYQGGPIPFYSNIYKEILIELMRHGLIDSAPLPEKALATELPFWNWLCNDVRSDYLEFLPSNGYSASWNMDKRKEVRSELLQKLARGEIDLVIAMGTWAGEDLVNDSHSVPTLVMSAAHFEKTGLIKSVDDSGFDHVSVEIDPTFAERQLRMFQRVTGFKKLGVAYENTDEGHRYSTIKSLEKVASDRNFTLNLCEVLDTTDDREKSRASCLSCFQELAANSDAIYISALLCADEEIDALATLFKEKKIFSYSFYGSQHVKKGILLGASAAAGYEIYGRHNSEKIMAVMAGTKPRALKQVVELPFFLSINTATAEAIDFKVPESISTIARDVYDQ